MAYELSSSLVYHLITTHLQGSTGILLGSNQAFACIKDVADTTTLKIVGKPLSLTGLGSVSWSGEDCTTTDELMRRASQLVELSYMLQGARSSTHSVRLAHGTSSLGELMFS